MLYRIEFRLDHVPDPLEFDVQLAQRPAEADVLAIVVHKLRPHEPAPLISSTGSSANGFNQMMKENGIRCISVFDEKGAALFSM